MTAWESARSTINKPMNESSDGKESSSSKAAAKPEERTATHKERSSNEKTSVAICGEKCNGGESEVNNNTKVLSNKPDLAKILEIQLTM